MVEQGTGTVSNDEDLKGRLLATFCPVLRFDAAEKHFPVSVETFISSSLLLRQERPPEERQRPYRPGAAAAATGKDSGDVAPTRHSEKRANMKGHACGECGKKKGWSVPRKGDWTIVPTPLGVRHWSTVTLLDMQRLFGDRYRFRLEPHHCIWGGQAGELSAVPCYAFAEFLDTSMMAPFIRRAYDGRVYELTYAFLYAYNGSTCSVPGASVGVHTGDLEHVTIRVDATRMMILEAFFAAHSTGEGKWVPSWDFYRQVKALEAKAHPGVAVKVPQSAREFLDTENAFVSKNDGSDLQSDAGGPSGGVDARVAGAGTKLVVYPSRDGHASYHLRKRWRRFAGLGDDVCGGNGVRWRPSPVQLGHPEGNTPAWLQFRGQYGAPGCITSEAFWKYQGEPLRRCSPEAKYRSLLEEGLVPDRGVRIGAYRRMLHGNGDRGVWLERHRQREKRLPIFDRWTVIPGLGGGRPQNTASPREAGRVWLHDWEFIKDVEGGSTDAQGWAYHVLSMVDQDADTGRTSTPQDDGLLVHRARGRVWFRVAGTRNVAQQIEAAYQDEGGRHPRALLALAALDVAGRGEKVTAISILETLLGTVDSGGDHKGHETGGGSTALGASSSDGGGVGATAGQRSFGSIARPTLGGVNV